MPIPSSRICGAVDDRLLAIHHELSRVRAVDAVDHLQQRALAGAVLTDERVHLARPDLEADIGVRLDVSEVLREAQHLEQRVTVDRLHWLHAPLSCRLRRARCRMASEARCSTISRLAPMCSRSRSAARSISPSQKRVDDRDVLPDALVHAVLGEEVERAHRTDPDVHDSSVSINATLPDERASARWKLSSSSMNEPSAGGGALAICSQTLRSSTRAVRS
jgi:hypothetical protein